MFAFFRKEKICLFVTRLKCLLSAYVQCWGSRVSVVSLETKLRTGWLSVGIPAEKRGFSLLQNFQTSSGAHPASYSMGTGVVSGDSEVDLSPPSSSEVKNEWSYTSTFQECLHDIDRNTFKFVPTSKLLNEFRA
jgi:hypothetical protein